MTKPNPEFETERLRVRRVREEDREAYMALRVKTSDFASAYTTLPELKVYEWESELNSEEDIYFSAFLKSTGKLTAIGSLQHIDSPEISIGFDVNEDKRNQGFGAELAAGLVQKAHSMYPGAEVCIKMKKGNAASMRVAEKCGGVFAGYEDTPVTKLLEAAASGVDDSGRRMRLKQDLMGVMQQGKNGICVYKMP